MSFKPFFSTLCLCLLGILANVSYAAEHPRIEVFNPGTKSIFAVSSEVVVGEKSVALIDAQFQKNDAETLVKMIKATGKPLSLVYISHSDPDYYFGLETIHAAFPQARIIATPETVAAINASRKGKLAYWSPKLGENAPDKIIVPQALNTDHFTLDDIRIDIEGLKGPTPARTFLWIPSSKTVLGGIPVEANMHVWIADTQTPKSRQDWIGTLDSITALAPQQVIPGHYLPNANGSRPFTTASVDFTRDYLRAFDDEASKATNSTELIAAMKKRYPNLAEESSLEMSAKVIKGEMQWP